MERNERETAICTEVADGRSLSQIGADFAACGVLSPDLTQLAQKLDRLIRNNLDLRRKLAAEEEAHAGTADRLDGAYQRIQELTDELAEALRQVELAEQEFINFRDAYARALDGVNHDTLRSALGEAHQALETAPFRAFLAEARLAANRAPPYPAGTGSGRLPEDTANRRHPETA